ncbi:hypothetical protein RGQ15_18635 [Paracoccus sp. MBLB3053]|uniref:Uncharacterized protein n=1 Tax=Paracoccus aurantius TaxID=3073814 RepID=A0ABU2HX06_9RHOB|nr:hypothetical protein [Paracoccus sp. MBLB3053]MDS9469587.1 hypothetical protein [Paracoccus sp. MBLB3053]
MQYTRRSSSRATALLRLTATTIGRRSQAQNGTDAPARPGIFEDFNLLGAAALTGHGVALCSLALIHPDLAARHLVQLSNTLALNAFDCYLTQSNLTPRFGNS